MQYHDGAMRPEAFFSRKLWKVVIWSPPFHSSGPLQPWIIIGTYAFCGKSPNQVIILIWNSIIQFSSVQLLSRVRLFATPWIAARQASLSITSSRSSLKLMSIESVMPSIYLILCRIPPSIRVFSNESTLHMRWPKYWSFSFSITPSKEHPGLISFRMDWLDLLAVQGTLKSLLQHHSSKASVLRRSDFFTTLTSIHDHRKNHSLD